MTNNLFQLNNNLKLPAHREEHTLEDMQIGEVAYTTPWALWVDMERNAHLNIRYTASPTPGGTVQLKVARLPQGYAVDTSYCKDYKWKPVNEPSYGGGHTSVRIVSIKW